MLLIEGEAEAIQLVHEAADMYFIGNAQVLRKLQVVENALEDNTKIVVPANVELINVVCDLAGVLPINRKTKASAYLKRLSGSCRIIR